MYVLDALPEILPLALPLIGGAVLVLWHSGDRARLRREQASLLRRLEELRRSAARDGSS